jgi:cytoskeletal protein CcmA (bactofilin family)
VTFTGSPSTSGGASFIFAGTAQNTGFTPYTTGVSTNNYNITWVGATSLTLDQAFNLNSFSFTNSGLIFLGNFNVQLTSVANLSGAPFSTAKMFVTNGTGRLIRSVQNTGVGLPFTWPIGEVVAPNTDYSPVTVTGIATPGVSGTIGFRVVDGVHPNMAPANNYLTRYWPALVSGFNNSYSLTGVSFTYDATNDVVNGPESALRVNSWNNSTTTWTEYTSTVTSPSIGTNGISGASMPTATGNFDMAVRVDVPLYYRTVSSGAWTTLTNWEASTSPAFTSPFTPGVAPNATNSALIRVQASHAMTLSADLTVDDLEVSGTIDQQAAFTLTLNNGAAATDATIFSGGTVVMSANSSSFSIPSGAVLLVNGTLRVSGSGTAAGGAISGAAGSTITMANGSTYDHNRDGGSLRMGSGTLTWQTGSTCQMTGQTSTNVTATSYGQAFSNFTFNCSSLSAAGAQTGGNLTTVNGNLRILNTGSSGSFNLSNGTAYTLSVGGNIQVDGGRLRWTNGGADTETCTINVTGDLIQEALTFIEKTSPMNLALTITGNFTQNGGTFDFSTSGGTTNTLTLRGNFRQDGVLQRGGGTTTFNFHRTSAGGQTWRQAGTVASSSAMTWNLGNGTNANTVQLLTDVNLGASGHPGFNVNNNCTFDLQGFVLSGANSNFIAQTVSTLRIGHPEGIYPQGNTTQGAIRTGGATKTFNFDVNYVYSGAANQITGPALPATVRTLTIANTGTSPTNVVTLSQNVGNFNNSVGNFLTLQSGLFNLNNFNVSLNNVGVISTGGDFTGTTGAIAGNGGTVNTTGTMNIPNVAANSSQWNFSTTSTVVNLFTLSGGNILNTGNPPIYGTSSTLIYNTNYNRFREWGPGVSGAGVPQNVQINSGFTVDISNNSVDSPAGLRTARGNVVLNGQLIMQGISAGGPLNINGNLQINATGNMNMAASANALTVGGNVTSTGTLSLGSNSGGDINVAGNWNVTNTFNINSRAVFFNGTVNQDVLSSNTFAFVFINNAAGVTLQANTAVSNNLTFSNGLLNLGNFNLTMQSGAGFSGASATRYARTNGNGRVIQTVGASNVLYPVGRSAYNPITLNNTGGASDTYGVILNDGATGFENNPNRIVVRNWDVNEGTGGGSNLTVTTQWNAPVAQTGEEASQFLRNDPSRTIGRYSGGAWTEGTTATVAGSNPYTYASGGFTGVGLFVPGMGDAFRAEPYIATVSSMSGYTGDVIQFTGNNLGTVSSITFGGTAATIITGTQTATFVEATITTGASGDIAMTNPLGSTTYPGWTYLGYITDTNGDWITPSVWRGGNVPPVGALTTINNTNTVNGTVANAPSQVTINSARSLTFGAAGTLGATTVINTGGTLDLGPGGTLTIAAGGTITNNGSFSGGASGTLVFAGAGTLAGGTVPTLRNFTINGGATLTNTPQILGTLLLNNGGFVSAAPTYGLNSTLQYNTGTTYGRNLEWSATSGPGYPANVRISGSTTLDLGNGGAGTARAMSGSLTIDSGSSLSMNATPMTQTLTVNGNVQIDGTLVLSSSSGGDIVVNGNWTRNTGGVFTDNGRAVFLRGTAAQTITGPAGGNSFPFLLMDKTGGSVTLANDVTVTNTLTFTATNTANVITGANALVISSTAPGAVVRTGAGYVNGTMRRGIASGTNIYDYPVGGASVYAPVSISTNGVTGTGNLAVRAVDGEHPNIAGSGINSTLSVNRYWTITPTMLSAASISPTFNFVAGDVDGGANTANFIIQRREIGIWNAVSVGTRTATSTQGVSVGGYGDFAIGECREPNSYSVTGGGSYCSGGAGVTVGLSGSDAFATYQLRLDGVNTGSPVNGTGSAITFGNQTPAGNYTVVATSIGSTCSAQMNGSAIVTITNPVTPQVTISTSPATTICVGASATFTAVPTNGGLTPTYQWLKNGSPVGGGGTTYTDGTLVNGDIITVVMTSSLTCVTTSTATSNAVTMTVTTPATWYRDLDGDGFGDAAVSISNCGQPVGYVANNTDCDDTSPVAAERFPGNDEFCDNVDNDCNSLIDDGLPNNIYYQDLDGDGRGNPAAQQIACAVPAGYVVNANDCNDACALCYVGAPEIADGLDNDCDLAVDEGFGPINDFRSNALVAVQSTYGLPCTPVTGTLLGATVSPESTTGTTVTGEDVWYYFTAVDTAYSITVTTTNYNLRIELHDDTSNPPNVTLRDAENFSTAVGAERLNYIGLIPGRTYFICVRNVNTAQTINPAGGQFQLCVNPLPRGGYNGGFGNNGPYAVNHNLCDVVNARFTRANQYRFEFRDLITNATYNGITTNNSTLMAFNSISGLIPGRQYELKIFSIYNTTRGDNSTPDIVECPPMIRPFFAANPPSIPQALPALNYTVTVTVNPHANLNVRSLDVCPTNRLLTQWIAAEPNICAAQFYQWRFTRVLPSPALPITWTSAVQFSRWARLQDVPGLQAGATYDVEIRPIFIGGFAGAWSAVPSCVRTVGPLMPLFRDDAELARPEERSLVIEGDEPIRANVFPNPTTGEVTMLEVVGYSGQVQLTIYNSAGQLVYTRNHDVADGEMVPIDLQQVLSNGLYNVLIQAGDRQMKRKLMVAR